MYAWLPPRPEEGSRTGFTDGCELSCECWELNLCKTKSALNHGATSLASLYTILDPFN